MQRETYPEVARKTKNCVANLGYHAGPGLVGDKAIYVHKRPESTDSYPWWELGYGVRKEMQKERFAISVDRLSITT